MKKVLKNILKVLSFIGVFILMVVFTLYASLLLICYGPSKSARNIFTTTFLETGAFKFVVHFNVFCSIIYSYEGGSVP